MDSHAITLFTKLAVVLFQDATQSAPQVTPSVAPQAASQGDGLALWQTIAFFIQAVAAVVIVIVTWRAARAGAERAYQLGEQAARRREDWEQKQEEARRDEQKKSLRLLLALEIRKNLKDLEWLRTNLARAHGAEDARYYDGASVEESAGRDNWLAARLRFVALYMPGWSHRAWDGQQSSPLLTHALEPTEILAVSYIHSQLDRLSQIKEMFAERLRDHDATPGVAEPAAPSPFGEDASYLWSDFVNVIQDVVKLDKPLADALKDAGVEYPVMTAEV
jgi:hypothetical protein